MGDIFLALFLLHLLLIPNYKILLVYWFIYSTNVIESFSSVWHAALFYTRTRVSSDKCHSEYVRIAQMYDDFQDMNLNIHLEKYIPLYILFSANKRMIFKCFKCSIP
jgi:hypothetical protein